MLSPTVFSFSPVAAIFCNATADCPACRSRSRRLFSVSMISLWRASYWSCVISPLARAVFACSAAVFRVSSFSFVPATASPKSLCFCASSSVLPGSNFKSFSTSRSCDCVSRMEELTPFNAVCSFVVSPPISTVIPLILFATADTPSC